jgi:hypothetical protein
MKNAIRNPHSNQVQVIDFDAATKTGAPLGAKASTAACPPEMVAVLGGRPVLLALQTASVADADVLRAHPSFDAWSYGVVMYELVAEQPLIPGADAQVGAPARRSSLDRAAPSPLRP